MPIRPRQSSPSGQTYFAVQTRRQELNDREIEDQRRLTIRSELSLHNNQLADAAKDAGVIEPRVYAVAGQLSLRKHRVTRGRFSLASQLPARGQAVKV